MKYITNIFNPCLFGHNYNFFHTNISIIITINCKLLSLPVKEFSLLENCFLTVIDIWRSTHKNEHLIFAFKVEALPPNMVTESRQNMRGDLCPPQPHLFSGEEVYKIALCGTTFILTSHLRSLL